MKKKLSFLLILLSFTFLFACGSNTVGNDSRDSEAASDQTQHSTTSESTPADVSATEIADPVEPGEPYEITYTNCNIFQDSIGSVWGQTMVEITNTSDHNLYLGSASYDLEDDAGSLIAAQSYVSVYPDVLQPGEKGYLYEETTFDQAEPEAAYTVIPHLDIEDAKIKCVRYDVTDISILDDEFSGIKIIGRVENTTEEDGSLVYVAAVLYDTEGIPLGIVSTILDEIAAGEKMGFEAVAFSLPDDVTADSVASYTIYAYPLQMQF